jgi:23S rRNA (guanosine2251-2'-O)-methyltransferase
VVVYGRNPVREALRGSRSVGRIWATQAAARENWLRELAGETPIDRASAEEIAALAGSDDHQGVAAEVAEFVYADAAGLLAPEDALVLVLDEIQDPQNLGALARVAESAGASGMVIAERRTAEVTPAACKASAGAVEHLKIARVGNISDFLAAAKGAGAWVYGAAADAETAYDQPDYSGKAVIVVGSEGRGMRPKVAKSCDALVSIPQRGRIGSLNVSTATAVLLYAVLQSRMQKKRP